MSYTRPDLGARLSASPSLAPLYRPFIRTLEARVEDCQCGECAQALDAAAEIFGAALLAHAGPRSTDYEDACSDLVSGYTPCEIGDALCATGTC